MQVWALAAIPHDRHIEGDVWFCRLCSKVTTALEDSLDATDEIQKGWLVVKAKYYYRVQRSPRGYQLQAQVRTLSVNALIRLPMPGVKFNALLPAQKKQQNPVQIMLDPAYNEIESGMHHVG